MKFRFIGIKNGSGNKSTFIENISIPKEFEDDPIDFIDSLDKSDIMSKRDLMTILDYDIYVKPTKKEKKTKWKDVALKWEEAYNLVLENSNTWERRANEWKKIALRYKSFISGESKENLETNNIASSLESGLPVDIKLNWDAGWLSPKGIFYGANGHINEMLHNKLANKLQEMGLIDYKETNPDNWLLERGWTKIHGNWILYEGYLIAKRSKFQYELNMPLVKAIPMTKEQRQQISLYGKICHGGILKFGLKQELMSSARFEMIDAALVWKLFDF